MSQAPRFSSGRPAASRRLLGSILQDHGVPAAAVDTALLRQQRQQARLGELLLEAGLIDRAGLARALALQFDYPLCPPGVSADAGLIQLLGLEACLQSGIVPVGRRRGRTVIATDDPDRLDGMRDWIEARLGRIQPRVTTPADLRRMLTAAAGPDLARRAETRVPGRFSVRTLPTGGNPRQIAAGCTLLLPCLLLFPWQALWLLFAVALFASLANSTLLLAVIALRPHFPAANRPRAAAETRLPKVSLIVPLYHEHDVAGALVKRLARLDYPKALLELWLVVEDDDETTLRALHGADLPFWMAPLVVPEGTLRTKPRALNFALDFCTGAIVGVYDAEDMPHPEQIDRVVQGFAARSAEIACLQGRLGFYNAGAGWLTTCFAVEYATWFRIVLPGLARIGWVVPLGGTTLFFRRAALLRLGGWDAHNVTEDADLGLRLARCGYRTDLLDSETLEEAPNRLWPWIRQRSRWLKGYALTWAVHLRQPGRLWRDLGAWRFLGVQVLFLGTLAGFVTAPLLWSFWLLTLGLHHPWQDSAPRMLLVGTLLLVTALATAAAQLNALREGGQMRRARWVPTLPFYFLLATAAAWRGLAECVTRPFFWDKTAHGVSPPDVTPPPRARHRA